MWRTKQERKLKEFRKLNERFMAIRPYNRKDENSVPLDEPYQRGEYRYFELRPDATRHPHAKTFKKILDVCQNVQYCRKSNWLHYSSSQQKQIPRIHNLNRIDKAKLEKNLEKWEIDRYFAWDKTDNRHWTSRYVFTGPSHYFISVKKPFMITHRTLANPEQDSEETKLHDYLYHNQVWDKLYGRHTDDWDHPPYRRGKEKEFLQQELEQAA